jgi:hypothetical protein
MEIELAGGPLNGQRRNHPLHPQLFGSSEDGQIHVWAWRGDQEQEVEPGDQTIPAYGHVGVLAL